MGAYGGLFCSAWDEDAGGIFGGQIRCVLNIGFGVAGWQFSQQPPVLGSTSPTADVEYVFELAVIWWDVVFQVIVDSTMLIDA